MLTFYKKIILILVLIVLVLGIGFGIVFLFKEGEQDTDIKQDRSSKEVDVDKEKETEEPDKSDVEARKENNRIYEEASSAGDVELCRKMSGSEASDICVKNIAIENKNKDECEYINDEEEERDCVDKILFREIEGSQDMELCSQMSSEVYTKRCINKVSNNLGGDAEKEMCDSFDGEIKDLCVDTIGFKEATSEADLSNCRDLEGEQEKMECIVAVSDSGGVKVDKSDCNEFVGDLRDYCKKVVNQQ